ncbi:MAG: hypothetical protein H7Z13_18880 [Ferruginibacter sp.]|nr:hypothetical protein [Ferruginibacter sp.]
MINNQNKNKVFLAIIAILLIANIAILAFFLQKKGSQDKQGGRTDRKTFIANFLKNEIGFNQQQLSQYDTLSSRHREKISKLFENARNNKNEQFKQLLAGNFSDSVISVVAENSSAAQKLMEIRMFTHIKSIRQLCTPEQLPKYDSLFIKVFSRRGDSRKKSAK